MNTSTLNLMTSSKEDTILSLSDLASLPIPTPLSYRHTPVLHAELVDMVITTVEAAGLTITAQQHAISNDEQKYFGLLQVSTKLDQEMDVLGSRDYTTVIGLRNSHDRSLGAGLVCGSGVMVCSNLCFYGEVRISMRHVGDIHERLLGGVQRSLPQVINMERVQDDRIAFYKRTPINTEEQIYPTLVPRRVI